MRQDIKDYFEHAVFPFIAHEHPDVVPEMSVRVIGSVGLGLNDELSDMEAEILLPAALWRQQGGQLQLTLVHQLEPFSASSRAHCECPGDPFSWMHFGHPEIGVHPRSLELAGQAEEVFAGKKDVPWGKISVEKLFELQNHLILRDADGFLARLRAVTAVELYPKPLWVKRIIGELAGLKGEPWDLEKAVRRGRWLEAEMILGSMLPTLLRLTFLINQRYYPWRKYLFAYLKDLPVIPSGLPDAFNVISSSGRWDDKVAAVNSILRVLTEMMLDSGMVSTDMLEYLLDAKGAEAWQNPNWREASDRRRRWAQEAGYDWLDGWIWGYWGWTGSDAESQRTER